MAPALSGEPLDAPLITGLVLSPKSTGWVISPKSQLDLGPGDGNIYHLFGFELCSSPTEFAIKSKYRRLCDKYHPDKHANVEDDKKQFYDGAMKLINGAKDEFDRWRRHPPAKKLYDSWLREQLKKAQEAESRVKHWKKVARWTAICMQAGAGIAMTSCGLVFAAPTGGAALAMSVGGSAALSASLKAGIGQYKNPNQSSVNFVKDVVVGAAAGTACGAVGAAAAPSIDVAIEAGRYGLASAYSAGVGALTSVASHGIEDVADVCDGSKELSDVLSLKNAASYLVDATMGAAAGIAVQGLSNSSSIPTDAASEFSDETAYGAHQLVAAAGKRLKVDAVGTMIESVGVAGQEAYACHEEKCACRERGAKGALEELTKGKKRSVFRAAVRAFVRNAATGLVA